MRIEQWMTRNPLTVEPHASVAHARALLREHRINQLPVMLNGRLIGIVTDRDLRDATGAIHAAATRASGNPSPSLPGHCVEDIAVESVMTTNVVTIEPHEAMARAAVLMRRERIGALPVVHRGKLQGIVTRTDVLRAYLALASYERKAGIEGPWKGAYTKLVPPRYAHR